MFYLSLVNNVAMNVDTQICLHLCFQFLGGYTQKWNGRILR